MICFLQESDPYGKYESVPIYVKLTKLQVRDHVLLKTKLVETKSVIVQVCEPFEESWYPCEYNLTSVTSIRTL